MRKVWITAEPWPASVAVTAAATAAGATEILHGIPASLAGVIPPGTTGYHELVEPGAVAGGVTPDSAIVALVQALAAPDATLDDVKAVASELLPQLPDTV